MLSDSRSQPGEAMGEHDTPKGRTGVSTRLATAGLSVFERMSKYRHLITVAASRTADKVPFSGASPGLHRHVKCRYIRWPK